MKPILLLIDNNRRKLPGRSPPSAAINLQSSTGTFIEMSLPCSGQRRNSMIIVCLCCMIVISYRASVVCLRHMLVCFVTALDLPTRRYDTLGSSWHQNCAQGVMTCRSMVFVFLGDDEPMLHLATIVVIHWLLLSTKHDCTGCDRMILGIISGDHTVGRWYEIDAFKSASNHFLMCSWVTERMNELKGARERS